MSSLADDCNARVEVLANDPRRDKFGAQVDAWTVAKKVWAEVKPLTGRALLAGRQVAATVDYQIRLRGNAFPNLSTRHRIRYRGQTFLINSVTNPDSRMIEFVVLATAVVRPA